MSPFARGWARVHRSRTLGLYARCSSIGDGGGQALCRSLAVSDSHVITNAPLFIFHPMPVHITAVPLEAIPRTKHNHQNKDAARRDPTKSRVPVIALNFWPKAQAAKKKGGQGSGLGHPYGIIVQVVSIIHDVTAPSRTLLSSLEQGGRRRATPAGLAAHFPATHPEQDAQLTPGLPTMPCQWTRSARSRNV
ncbi:hypothetical protein LX32DRAFT_37816 [Colletotrichum zoysiae]|uniref:Uncharacterized protein n=1 Tax=Colletotrichum zoysiae TaxID=1216348 RepID=A0AAD9LYV6_9PEZI|nr:hypothetical protein LX32DRAFT_37816 [Colletotrichum zoysiae]